MNLIDFLKGKRKQLLDASNNITPNIEQPKKPTIEIIIENDTNAFENEQEIIKKGAQEMLNNRSVDNFEEGIIVFATIVRGLRYKRTEKDEEGNIKIILKDIVLETSSSKVL